ncbi:ANR family transcriptional regulator [Proteus hauseri]|uniref:ANR family transcriptional regulator n=1 Tax=Proteus hauseri TaxID=183417 RepID=UPI0032DAC8FC
MCSRIRRGIKKNIDYAQLASDKERQAKWESAAQSWEKALQQTIDKKQVKWCLSRYEYCSIQFLKIKNKNSIILLTK